MKETDLYAPVKQFLVKDGYCVRGEVAGCDLYAVKDEQIVIVELKLILSIQLIGQAVERQKIADLVYIAVPKPQKFSMRDSKWKRVINILHRLELGLIFVSLSSSTNSFNKISVIHHPTPFNLTLSKSKNKEKRKRYLNEFNQRSIDGNIGGCVGVKLMTSYREKAMHVACLLDDYGPMSPSALRKLGADDKKVQSILNKNFYGWFDKVKRGTYSINAERVAEIKSSKFYDIYLFQKIYELKP